MNQDNDLEVTAYEIDGKDYVISKIVNYEGSNYCYLVNVDDDLGINITDITAELHEDE